jgi:farnesyl diphosphate synthase
LQNNKLLDTFENYLIDNLPKIDSFHPHFQTALQDMLKAGGKRFRPMLILSVINDNEPMLIQNSFKVALGVELLHTYSLIHDDLPSMDNALLRRGNKTLHIKYDEVTAILVGDALNTHSFSLISNAPLSDDIKIKLIQCLSCDGGIDGMIIGQAIDCFFENKILSLDELKFLHIHKTAKLIASSLKMGAIISNLPKDEQDKFYNFGIDLGLLFQIQDDIADTTQTSKKAGKTTQNDNNKNSFVNLLGLKEAINSADILANKCDKVLQKFQNNHNLNLLVSKYLFRHKNT